MNAIVYVSDALRADHLGCYGARFLNTRTIDELAATGLRFEEAITASSWTAPSMTSIVTGLYPHHHGVLDWGSRLDPSVATLFSSYREGGYEVASFVFDDAYLFQNVMEANVQGRSDGLDGVISWLRAHRSEPFLLLVHSWATHMPYNVRHTDQKEWKAAKRKFIERIRSNTADGLEACREAYRLAVEYQSETLVSSLLEALDDLGLRDDTVLVFGADHGESWGERFVDKADIRGVYHLHGAALYDEILRVPLVLSAPGRLEPAVVPTQVRTVDLAPTLVELAGLPAVPGDGDSLLPLVRGEEREDRVALSATSDKGVLSQLAVRRPPWKLIRDLRSGEEEAYRLDLDPRERESRADEVPADLRALLDLEAADLETGALSEEEEAIITKRLADLGYL